MSSFCLIAQNYIEVVNKAKKRLSGKKLEASGNSAIEIIQKNFANHIFFSTEFGNLK